MDAVGDGMIFLICRIACIDLSLFASGGTLFDASKLGNALRAQTLPEFFKREKWLAMGFVWIRKYFGSHSMQDQAADTCLTGVALVANMTIGAQLICYFLASTTFTLIFSKTAPYYPPLSLSP